MRLLLVPQIRTVGSRWLPVAKDFSRATPQLVLGISSKEMKLPLEKQRPQVKNLRLGIVFCINARLVCYVYPVDKCYI